MTLSDIIAVDLQKRNGFLWYHQNKIFSFPKIDYIYEMFETLNYIERENMKMDKDGLSLDLILNTDLMDTWTLLKALGDADYLILRFRLYRIVLHKERISYEPVDEITLSYLKNNEQDRLHAYALVELHSITKSSINRIPISALAKVYNLPETKDVEDKLRKFFWEAAARYALLEHQKNERSKSN